MNRILTPEVLINIIFIAMGIGICLMSIMQVSSGIHIRMEVKKYFQVFFLLILIYISMHLSRMMLEGQAGLGAAIALRTVTFIEFVVSGFMVYFLFLLILVIANPGKKPATILNICMFGLVAVQIIMLIVSQYTDLFYYFDEANFYHRSAGYGISNVVQIIMLVVNVFLLIKYRKNFKRSVASALWFYLIAPLLAIAIQFLISDVQFIILVTVIAAAYLCYVIVKEQTIRYEHQKEENTRLDAELSMATKIQAESLPSIFPAFPEREDFTIYASMNPAKEVGGDFYDFFLIDETHLGIVMADVSGKGVPAALFMMMSKILVQNFALLGKNPKDVLEAVNRQICIKNPGEMFVTVWFGSLDLVSGKLTAVNAGHEYPVFKKAGESFELVKDKHGLVIGAMETAKYKEYELQMDPGSKIFLYTDGVAEATNAKNELFGTDRMVEALRRCENGTPREILDSVNDAVNAFVQDAPQFDDLTMLCLEYHGQKAE